MALATVLSAMAGNDCGEKFGENEWTEEAKPQTEVMIAAVGSPGFGAAVRGLDKRLNARMVLGWLERARMREFPSIYIPDLPRRKATAASKVELEKRSHTGGIRPHPTILPSMSSIVQHGAHGREGPRMGLLVSNGCCLTSPRGPSMLGVHKSHPGVASASGLPMRLE